MSWPQFINLSKHGGKTYTQFAPAARSLKSSNRFLKQGRVYRFSDFSGAPANPKEKSRKQMTPSGEKFDRTYISAPTYQYISFLFHLQNYPSKLLLS